MRLSTVAASDLFAYAEAYDEETGKYVGLRLGGGGSVVMNSSSLLVNPEAARAQLEAEEAEREARELAADGEAKPKHGITYTPQGRGDWQVTEPLGVSRPRRFYASVTLDPERVGRDAGKIADEVLSHLSVLPRAKLTVSMEIEAELPEGAPEDVQRTVSENAGVLKFDSHGFERK